MAIIEGKIEVSTNEHNDLEIYIKLNNRFRTCEILSHVIVQELKKENEPFPKNWLTDLFGKKCHVYTSLIPNVQLSIHTSNKDITYLEAMDKLTLLSMGELDTAVDWYGYSEYTIMGYETVKFTLGGHDLNNIFKSYDQKYVVIEVKVLNL